jgi:hypothetical protein
MCCLAFSLLLTWAVVSALTEIVHEEEEEEEELRLIESGLVVSCPDKQTLCCAFPMFVPSLSW